MMSEQPQDDHQKVGAVDEAVDEPVVDAEKNAVEVAPKARRKSKKNPSLNARSALKSGLASRCSKGTLQLIRSNSTSVLIATTPSTTRATSKGTSSASTGPKIFLWPMFAPFVGDS